MIESKCKVSADTIVDTALELLDKRPANEKSRESILELYSDFSVNTDNLNRFNADIELPEGSAAS